MFTHYGLYWSERDVFWGSVGRNNAGMLLGREKITLGRQGAPTKEEREKATDFRLYIGVYCLYNQGQLMYIGEAGLGGNGKTIFGRLNEHRKDHLSNRWDHFSWFGREKCEGDCEVKNALAQLEAVAIAMSNPGYNKQSGTFGNASPVFQVPHEDAEGDLETKLERLFALLAETKTP